ncbi:5-carboxymethyl-2-hydroxymuconate isomerase [Sphingobium lactosutens]|nr:5-carboxymethyl-2-hydroxymuconate isomerase [Sphingobium lactosutens]
MRFVSFRLAGQMGYGAVIGDAVVRLDSADLPSLRAYIERHFQTGWPDLPVGPRIPFADLELLPPVPDAGKILCVATNFREASLGDKPEPSHPLLFTRFADSFVGHGQPLEMPCVTQAYDFEGELAVVIGRYAHRVTSERAMDHVAGYSCLNDGSVRDWQKHSSQFTAGKNFYHSGSMGPWLVTCDEIPAFADLSLETRVNGSVEQRVGMDRMIFDVPWLVAYLSRITPLAPGDIIATGTPSGFGASRRPQHFLAVGDMVEVEIPGVGRLNNIVAHERM